MRFQRVGRDAAERQSIRTAWIGREPAVIAAVLFFCAFGVGVLFAKISCRIFALEPAQIIYDCFAPLAEAEPSYGALFLFLLKERLLTALLVLVLSTTILAFPYLCVRLAVFAFRYGYLCCIVTMAALPARVRFLAAFVFPQLLAYVPAFVIALQFAWERLRVVLLEKKRICLPQKKQLQKWVRLFMMIMGLLMVGAFFEGYFGTFFLQRALHRLYGGS